ncbi:hypothetical protein FA15DRAFT_676243 [Coprinopsis marcescibilis]|uniref:Uncharacterized protein n=1 Tax=Coprinopsis marcescibilis TaxID=230819 RepID=A0A5C3KB43_COPMA|nr:hypothetical protein FA15DRAFT_676243 [Coprinopsis marcescibilis]
MQRPTLLLSLPCYLENELPPSRLGRTSYTLLLQQGYEHVPGYCQISIGSLSLPFANANSVSVSSEVEPGGQDARGGLMGVRRGRWGWE